MNDAWVLSKKTDKEVFVRHSTLDVDCDLVSLEWSPDGNFLALGFSNGTIGLVKGRTLRRISLFQGWHTATVNSISWSSTSKHICSCSDDGTVRIWDINTMKQVAIDYLPDSSHLISCLSWSPTGNIIAMGGLDHRFVHPAR